MNYFGFLPEPIDIVDERFPDIFNEEHELFKTTFVKKENRPKLFNKFIYVSTKNIEGINERFLHCTSFDDVEKYKMFPCNNDFYSYPCRNNCEKDSSLKIYKEINRINCNYRLSRVRWIVPIIEKVESSDKIKTWSKDYKDNTTDEWHTKRFIRYQDGLVDFVIIFNKVYRIDEYHNSELYMYNFRTAYPLFNKYDKKDFDRDYANYIELKKPVFP